MFTQPSRRFVRSVPGRRLTPLLGLKPVALVSAFLLAMAGLTAAPAGAASGSNNANRPSSPHFMRPRNQLHGAAGSGAAFDTTTDMTYHNGPVMRDVTNYAIFWNPTTPPGGLPKSADVRQQLPQHH